VSVEAFGAILNADVLPPRSDEMLLANNRRRLEK
jgi:hypothetical protein